MKNSLTSNIDKDLMNEIRGSLFNPNGAYLRNLREVKEIDWSWNNGQTKTTITYGNNVTETRDNSEVPPTQACHDIAHFIAALNGNMEWDYVQHISLQTPGNFVNRWNQEGGPISLPPCA